MSVFGSAATAQEERLPPPVPDEQPEISEQVELLEEDLDSLRQEILMLLGAVLEGQEAQLASEDFETRFAELLTEHEAKRDAGLDWFDRNSGLLGLIFSILGIVISSGALFQANSIRREANDKMAETQEAISADLQATTEALEKIQALSSRLEELIEAQEQAVHQQNNMSRIFGQQLGFMREAARGTEVENRKTRAALQGQITDQYIRFDKHAVRRLGYFPPNFRYFTDRVNASHDQIILQMPFATFGLMRNPLAWRNFYGTLEDNFRPDQKMNKDFLFVTYGQETAAEAIRERVGNSVELQSIIANDTKFNEICRVLGGKIAEKFQEDIAQIYPERREQFFFERRYDADVKDIIELSPEEIEQRKAIARKAFVEALITKETECFQADDPQFARMKRVNVGRRRFDNKMVMFVDGGEMIDVKFDSDRDSQDRDNRVQCATGSQFVEDALNEFDYELLELVKNNIPKNVKKSIVQARQLSEGHKSARLRALQLSDDILPRLDGYDDDVKGVREAMTILDENVEAVLGKLASIEEKLDELSPQLDNE